MDLREEKGRQIASRFKIVEDGKHHLVPSESNPRKRYRVYYGDGANCTCTCEDFEQRRKWCKHIWALHHLIDGDVEPPKNEPPQKPRKPTYRQQWPAYNAAQTHEKDHFLILLRDLCQQLPAAAPGDRGGRPRVPLSDIVFVAALKVYLTRSARRSMPDVREAVQKGYLSSEVGYNTLLGYLGKKELTAPLTSLIRQSALPLRSLETKFALDATGISTSRFRRWFNQREAVEREQREWVKLHLICGVRTNVVTEVIVSDGSAHESPYLPALVVGTADRFIVAEVMADKGFSGVENLEAIAGVGAEPYIPFKQGATGDRGGIWRKLFHYYEYNRDEFLGHYHQRSNVESTFSMIKAKFGDSVRSKTNTAAKNEALVKVLCHNLCCLIQSMYELGVNVDFAVS